MSRTPPLAGPIEAPTSALVNPYHIDVSLGTPAEQYETLVGLIASADAKAPAPYTLSPPGGEWIPEDEFLSQGVVESNYMPPPDLEAQANVDLLKVIADPAPAEFPAPEWENDDQYHGLAVPPGIPNYGQPIETGHSQINLPNPGGEVGAFAWSGAISLARVARHENGFKSYAKGSNRGHGVSPEKFEVPYVIRTQQGRDLLLAELKKRGAHNIVVQDVPAQTYNEQVLQIDPSALQYQVQDVGAEGVLP